jgi:hypothetical protein
MAGKKKKNRTLFLLLGAIVALAALYVVVNQIQTRKEAEKKAQEQDLKLYGTSTTGIQRIHVVNEYYDMTLVKNEEDVWQWEGREDFDVSKSRVTSMISAVMNLTADTRVADQVDDPSLYGLENPTAKVEIESEDGNVSFIVGGRAPVGSAFYLTVEGDPSLYTVPSDYYYAFHRTEAQMMEVEEAEAPSPAAIRHILVSRDDGITMEFVYDSKTGTGSLIQPYSEAQFVSAEQAAQLQGNYRSFSFKECQGVREELNLADYGLDKPAARIQAVWQDDSTGEDVTADLTVGAQTEDGKFYYVLWESSGRVYTMEKEIAEAMVTFDPFDYIQTELIREGEETISAIRAEKDGNGKTLDAGQLEAMKSALAEIRREDDLLGTEPDEKAGEPVLTLTLEGEFGEKVLAFYPYDEHNFYRLSEDGVSLFLVGKREVDAACAVIGE